MYHSYYSSGSIDHFLLAFGSKPKAISKPKRKSPKKRTIVPKKLPNTVTGTQLRYLSSAKSRSHCLVKTRPSRERCHRVPNSLLTKAYNSTSNYAIKEDIVAFNYSSDNMFNGKNNGDHSRMERGFISGNISAQDFQRKSNMLTTALTRFFNSAKYSLDSFCHILHIMLAQSPTYRHFVSKLDLRVFNDDRIKSIVVSLRLELKNESQSNLATKSPTRKTSKQSQLKPSEIEECFRNRK